MQDARTEQWLKRHHATWDYVVDLPLSQIDQESKTIQNVRLSTHGKMYDDNIISMAMALEQGEDLPAMVLCHSAAKQGRYEIIGGNHRFGAFELYGKRKKVDAYVVRETDPNFIDQLRRFSNAVESMPGFSSEERVLQAMAAVQKDGVTAKAAAAALGIKTALVTDRIRAQKVFQELMDEGISEDILCKLSNTERKDLHVIRSPRIRAQVVQLCHELRLPAEERKRFYKEVAETNTEQAATEKVEKWKETFKGRYLHATQGKKSPFARLYTLDADIRRMEKSIKEKIPPDVQTVITSLRTNAQQMLSLAKMLERLYGSAA